MGGTWIVGYLTEGHRDEECDTALANVALGSTSLSLSPIRLVLRQEVSLFKNSQDEVRRLSRIARRRDERLPAHHS
jgi:hypothetical protein